MKILRPTSRTFVVFAFGLAASFASSTAQSTAWAAPEPVVVLGEPEIVYVDAPQVAQRSATAAQRPSPPKAPNSPATSKGAPKPAAKRWVCGEWEELWQGRGQGRTCEWR
jgi:hypothetical protein